MAPKSVTPPPDDQDDDKVSPAPTVPPERLASHYRDMHEKAARAVRSRVELLSPKAAAAMLERNDHNRPLSNAFAERYAAVIAAGQWCVNGQGVIRDAAGALLDGQHRLTGIVASGVAVPVLVIDGVDRDAFMTIDQGRKRDFAGYLGINREKNAATLAGAVRLLMWFETLADDAAISAREAARPTMTSLFTLLDLNPGIRDSVDYISPHRLRRVIQPSPLTCLHYLTTRRHPGAKSADFWKQILTGNEVAEKSPAALWRKVMVQNASGPKSYPVATYMALTIKAFNYTITGKRLTCLKYAAKEEEFPEIV